MRIVRRVCVLVVTAVPSDPPKQRPLHSRRADDPPGNLQPRVRLERPVDEQAMKSDRDPQNGEYVRAQQKAEAAGACAEDPQTARAELEAARERWSELGRPLDAARCSRSAPGSVTSGLAPKTSSARIRLALKRIRPRGSLSTLDNSVCNRSKSC